MIQATDKQDKANEQMQREAALDKRVKELETQLTVALAEADLYKSALALQADELEEALLENQNALIAAAYADAAFVLTMEGLKTRKHAVSKLLLELHDRIKLSTPADAKAALDRMLEAQLAKRVSVGKLEWVKRGFQHTARSIVGEYIVYRTTSGAWRWHVDFKDDQSGLEGSKKAAKAAAQADYARRIRSALEFTDPWSSDMDAAPCQEGHQCPEGPHGACCGNPNPSEVLIETDTGFGRARVYLPAAMSEADRATFFDDMAGFERAEKRPMTFDDNRHPVALPTPPETGEQE